MLYWSDEASAKKFQDLYNSALSYAAAEHGSFESFFNAAGKGSTMNTPKEMLIAAEELKESFAAVEGYKGEYLRDMLCAVKTFVLMLNGEEISYTDAVKRILGIEIREIPRERAERVRKEIDDLLLEDGYDQKTTALKVQKWYEDNLIQPEELEKTARQYLDILQKQTRAIIPLPEKEHIGKMELVQGVSWGAFSQYEGDCVTNMLMNRDSIWKRPTFIDTVSHELYPGHHTWYSMRESGFARGEVPLEAATLGICSAENLLFEGMPESGAHFTGIDDPDCEIEGMERELRRKIMVARKILEYVRIIEINSCYHYHVDKWSKEKLIHEATKDGWVEPKVAERVFTYYSHPFNGLYYPSYYYGRWIVTYAYDRFTPETRPLFFKIAYEEPHSTGSFIRRIEEVTGEPFDPVKMAQS